MKARIERLLTMVVVLVLVGCRGGLPWNFSRLPLEEQVAAYERHFQEAWVPDPIEEARQAISGHGAAAAELMVKYFRREPRGLPRIEVVEIIRRVQSRGCSLRGTVAEQVLRKFVASDSNDEATLTAARFALEMIAEDRHSEPRDLSDQVCRVEQRGL